MTFISYSQNFEDVMLWRALKHIENGFYVDVGANDPKFLSVTRAFYDRGWRGINIDPVTYPQLALDRTRDINLELAVSNREGEINFYEVPESALCTTDPQIAESYRQSGRSITERRIRSMTLNQVLSAHSPSVIHFLNIDVEGGELQVLEGLDLNHWRPWILLIEATIPTTTIPSFDAWEQKVRASGYEFVYFDGLNRFYIAREHQELMKAFDLPPNIFDEFILSNEMDLKEELGLKEKELIAKEEIIQRYRNSFTFWIANGPFQRYQWFQVLINGANTLRHRFRS